MDVDLAVVGRLLGDESRAAMLDALMSGRALAAGELARVAGVTAPTASEHLARLARGGLVESVSEGRHRYYRLAGPEVGVALETLSSIAPPKKVSSLRQSALARSLAYARTCYDHLAGHCAVGLHDVAIERGWLVADLEGYDLSAAGERSLVALGVDIDAARARRRRFARPCLDWTERRPHLAGALGAGLAEAALAQGWFVRRDPHSRGLRLTDKGRSALKEVGVELD